MKYVFFSENHGNDEQGDSLIFRQVPHSKSSFDHRGSNLMIYAYGDDNSVILNNSFSGSAIYYPFCQR